MGNAIEISKISIIQDERPNRRAYIGLRRQVKIQHEHHVNTQNQISNIINFFPNCNLSIIIDVLLLEMQSIY
jgi:hypothetical protein